MRHFTVALCAVSLVGCSTGSITSTQVPLVSTIQPHAAQHSADAVPTTVAGYKVLYVFKGYPSDGAEPAASLISVNGKLYGTTLSGGESDLGTVFSVTTAGVERTLHSFPANSADGIAPQSNLVFNGGLLYGTTPNGYESGYGVVFSIATSGAENIFFNFASPGNGEYPVGSLINSGGTFYGTTEDGGSKGDGTVYSLTDGGVESVIHSFAGGTDGANPTSSLVLSNGTLYGVTGFGGKSGYGTVFALATSGKETVLHNFTGGNDGTYPISGLVEVNGALYGTTSAGGPGGFGTVFKITKSGSETVLYAFQGKADGAYPTGNLIYTNGSIYGTTTGYGAEYGNGADGSVFKMTLSGTVTVLHTFAGGTDGGDPIGGLYTFGGALYGTTSGGTTGSNGTVFVLPP